MYTNPVLDIDFPDPTVILASDGWYYAYATQTVTTTRITNVNIARSPDLVNWTPLPDALPEKPSWASETQDFWAPRVLEENGTYYMYYSAEPNTRDGLCVAVATASQAAGPFKDVGAPLACAQGFLNIDPMPFDDPQTGKKLLYWGSGFGPIKVRELTDDRMSFAPGTEAVEVLYPGTGPYEELIEGVFVTHRDGYYYMYYSGNNCCGESPSYAVMVARSRNAMGPFEKLAEATGGDSSVILEHNDHWDGPGHNCVVTDATGQDWLVCHAIDASKRYLKTDDPNKKDVRRPMIIERLVYRDGWPRVGSGTPSVGPAPAPAAASSERS